MAIRLNEEHQTTGSGLGYQMSSYVFMRSLANRTGFKYAIDPQNLYALKNTFDGLVIDEEDAPGVQGKHSVEFMIDDSFDDVLKTVKDNTTLYGYPTPSNAIDITQIEEVKSHFKFRDEIESRCKSWKESVVGDSEVIAIHLRRGDFVDDYSGMFLIDDDYYLKALKLLPKDIPVLIFTNDKEYVRGNENFSGDRFILVDDIVNFNQPTSDLSRDIDINVDKSGDNLFNYSVVLESMGNPELDDYLQNKIDNRLYNYSHDMCLMSMCDYHVIANSTFSLWAVELSNTKRVVYPMYWSQGLSDDLDAVLCDNPESCRPGFRCNQDTTIARDLGGFDQTASALGYFMKDDWIGLENPDQRAKKWGCC